MSPVARRSRQVSSPEISVREYVEILFRRKMLFILPAVIIFAAALVVSSSLPKIYEAQTLVFIQTPVVLNPLDPLNSEKLIEMRLRTIREEILSFRFLSSIIDSVPEINLTLNSDADRESYVSRMRRNVDVRTRGIDLFEISYQDPSPKMTQILANRVTRQYIEDNLSRYSSDYQQALVTLEKEKQRLLEDLRQQEKKMTQFRELHKDYLIPDSSIKQQIVNQQRELRALANELQAASREMRVIRNKLKETPETIESKRILERDPKYELIERELRTLELERDELLLKYTENHPMVKSLNERIELRSTQLEQLEDSFKENIEESMNPTYLSLLDKITQQEIRMENLLGRIESGETQLGELQVKESKVPQLEEDNRNLVRDYEIKKNAYERVVRQIESKDMQKRLEEHGQQIKFEIRDSARLPRAPIEPNVTLIAAGGLGLGLAVGLGLVFGREYFDHSLRSVEQARSHLNIPVLGAIPVIVTEEELRRSMTVRRRWMVASLILALVLLGALGLLTYWYWDQILLHLGFL